MRPIPCIGFIIDQVGCRLLMNVVCVMMNSYTVDVASWDPRAPRPQKGGELRVAFVAT